MDVGDAASARRFSTGPGTRTAQTHTINKCFIIYLISVYFYYSPRKAVFMVSVNDEALNIYLYADEDAAHDSELKCVCLSGVCEDELNLDGKVRRLNLSTHSPLERLKSSSVCVCVSALLII